MFNKALGKHAFFYLVANIIPSLFSFVGLMIFTRLLNPREYGIYFMTYSTAVLFFSLLFGGISMSIKRFCPGIDLKSETPIPGNLNTLILLMCLCGIVGFGMFALLVPHDLLLYFFVGTLIFIFQGIKAIAAVW